MESKLFRRIYFSLTLIVFILITVTVLFYSQGYYFDFSKKEILKTSSLYLESNPKNSQIYLNNEIIKDQTPKLVNRLTPGSQYFSVFKKGYLPYEKTVTTKSGEAVYFSDIYLYRADTNPVLLDKHIQDYLILGENKFLYTVKSGTSLAIKLFDNDKIETIQTFENSALEFVEQNNYPNSQAILKITSPEKASYYLFSTNQKNLTDISNLIEQNFTKINKIKPSQDEGVIFISTDHLIYQVNINNNEIVEVAMQAATISDFFIQDDIIYYLYKSDGKMNLVAIRYQQSDSSEKLVSTLAISDSYLVNTENSNYFIITDPVNNQTLLITLTLNQVIVDYLNIAAKNLSWNQNQDLLAFYNNFEIWYYQTIDHQSTLVNRQSEKINSLVWHPSKQDLIFSQNDKIYVVEREEKFGRYFTELVNFGANTTWLDSNGEILYWLAPNGTGLNFYQKNIR